MTQVKIVEVYQTTDGKKFDDPIQAGLQQALLDYCEVVYGDIDLVSGPARGAIRDCLVNSDELIKAFNANLKEDKDVNKGDSCPDNTEL